MYSVYQPQGNCVGNLVVPKWPNFMKHGAKLPSKYVAPKYPPYPPQSPSDFYYFAYPRPGEVERNWGRIGPL